MKKKLLLQLFLCVTAFVAHGQAYISEIMLDPPGDDIPYEYIELRGIPNAPLTNMYLIVVEGDEADPGDINTVHDLTSLSFGANGYLVLANAGHPYTIDSDANVVTGLLGGPSGSANGLEGQTHTFMLIQSTTPPTDGDDIDSNDDGIADGAPYNTWTILDSGVAFVKDNQNGNDPVNNDPMDPDPDAPTSTTNEVYVYADVVFVEDDSNVLLDPTINGGPNMVFIRTPGTQFEYAARIGSSTGSLLTADAATSDWVGGNVNSNANIDLDGTWQLGSSSSAIRTYPEAVEGETLDNIGSANFPNIWTGDTSNDWDTDANWQNGATPEVYETAVIRSSGVTNYPNIASLVEITAINIESGASLIANAAVTSDVTYTRNLPTTNWYLISMPITGETAQDIIANHTLATGTATNIGLSFFVNDNTGWYYGQATSSGPLTNGEGYGIKLATAGNMSVTGTINTSDVDKPINTGTGNSFNLVGNPFTSYVNSSTFFTDNSAELSENTIWMWDGSQYVTYNMIIPIEIAPTQGFFVSDNPSSALGVTFSTANQSHQTDTFMKQELPSNFELFVEKSGSKKSTKVFYLEGKTAGFDNGYDSKMFGGVETDFAVFTELVTDNQGNKLAIQTLSNDDLSAIPVGLIAKAGEEITFSATATNLPNDGELYLENRLTGEFTNLTETTYKITLEEDVNEVGQFYLHTVLKSLSTIEEDLNTVSVYSSAKNELTIAGLNGVAEVSVFTLLGENVVNTKLESNGVSKLSLPALNTGIYVVSLKSDLGILNKKIILE